MSEEKIVCNKCGNSHNNEFIKDWDMKSGRSGVKLNVKMYDCPACNKSFRITKRIE